MLKLKKIPVKKSENEYPLIDSMDYSLAYPPSFSANEKQISEIEDWKVGETYRLVVDVKMTSLSSSEKGGSSSRFDVVGYKVIDDVDEMSDADLEEMQGQGLSN